jgi:hypothetical protein
VTDQDVLDRLATLEARVQELQSVQDLLLRLLSTSRPLANLLEYFGATEAAAQALYQLLDEMLAGVHGPAPRHPTFNYFQMRLNEIFPALRGDRTFVQTLIDTLKTDRAAYRELHTYMTEHGWPAWT